MKSDKERERLNGTSGAVLACAFKVSRALGHGFLEKVYENALVVELREEGHTIDQQETFDVLYRGRVVGKYCPDLIVDGGVIVEIKALNRLEEGHRAQCLNYLRVTGHSMALLLNFGRPRIDYRRVVWEF